MPTSRTSPESIAREGGPLRIRVHAKPNARIPSITRTDAGEYRAAVDAPAHDGRANERLVELLAAHFRCPVSCVQLVSGGRGRWKVFEIVR